jgi:hypothetical protein
MIGTTRTAAVRDAVRSGQVRAWLSDGVWHLLDLETGRLFRTSRFWSTTGPDEESRTLPEFTAPLVASPVPDIASWRGVTTPFIPLFTHRGRLCVGPLVRVDACPCVTCVVVRLLAATPFSTTVAPLWAAGPGPAGAWFTALVTDDARDIAAQATRVARLPTVLRSRPIGGDEWTTHRVRSLPGAPDHRLSERSRALGLS